MAERRSRRKDSLASVITGILGDSQIPLPNEVVRVLASERSGKEISSEQLARVSSYEKENFLRTRMPPLLCSAVDRQAVALRPRAWAAGDWRLARRIATPDVQSVWQGALAVVLLDEVLFRFPPASEHLQRLTLEAVARVLGPVAAYLPSDRSQWEQLRVQVLEVAPNNTPAGHSSEQAEAEAALTAYRPAISPVSLYFGVELAALTRSGSAPSKLRLPGPEENGEPFDRVLSRRLDGDEEKVRGLSGYLQGWSFLRDELGRSPTSSEFADHWKFDAASVRGDEAVFAEAFPEEDSPERIIRLLEEALPRTGQMVRMMGILVLDESTKDAPPSPAPGQTWRRGDGARLTISTVSGRAIVGHLSDPSGEASLWASSREKLLKEFRILLPQDLWAIAFDVDVEPSSLTGAFARNSDIELISFRRPSDPRPNQAHLRAGTIRLQVLGKSPDDAKKKVIECVAGTIKLSRDEIHAVPFSG